MNLIPYFTSTTPTPVPVSDVLSQAGEVVTSMLGWVTSVANTIMSNGILFVTTGILILGGVIGIFGRLLSKN